MTLEASIVAQYTDYSEFRTRFEHASAIFLEHFAPSRIAQQGLRYINHLDQERAVGGWGNWINPILLGAIGAEEFGEELQQAICDFRFRRPDGTLVFKHGVVHAVAHSRPPGICWTSITSLRILWNPLMRRTSLLDSTRSTP